MAGAERWSSVSAETETKAKTPEVPPTDDESLAVRLLWVQTHLKAPKDQFNSFGKYKYRSSESILEHAKPLLKDAGLTLTMDSVPETIGGWHYVRSAVTVQYKSARHRVSGYAREDETKKGMDGAQITGTATSYATKRALGNLFLIDDTADNDATDDRPRDKPDSKASAPMAKAKPTPKAAAPDPMADVRNEFKAYIHRVGISVDEGMRRVLAAADASDMGSLTAQQRADALGYMRNA
jgi:hypothetical protein